MGGGGPYRGNSNTPVVVEGLPWELPEYRIDLFVILIATRSVVWENCHRTVFLQDTILSWFALGAG